MPVRPVSSRFVASDYYMNYYTRKPRGPDFKSALRPARFTSQIRT